MLTRIFATNEALQPTVGMQGNLELMNADTVQLPLRIALSKSEAVVIAHRFSSSATTLSIIGRDGQLLRSEVTVDGKTLTVDRHTQTDVDATVARRLFALIPRG